MDMVLWSLLVEVSGVRGSLQLPRKDSLEDSISLLSGAAAKQVDGQTSAFAKQV